MAIVNERMTMTKVQQAERELARQQPSPAPAGGPLRPGQPVPPPPMQAPAQIVGPLSMPPSQTVQCRGRVAGRTH
jgi:hypothetical protein